jgi:hypothetical protein
MLDGLPRRLPFLRFSSPWGRTLSTPHFRPLLLGAPWQGKSRHVENLDNGH